MFPAQKTRLGSRAWFNAALKDIAKALGEDGRDCALHRWREHGRDFGDGVPVLEQMRELAVKSAQVKDAHARRAIQSAFWSDDPSEVEQMNVFLDGEVMREALTWQGMSEDKISEMAELCKTPENSTGHLRERRRLRRTVKQATATANLHLGLVGGQEGFKHCTPFERSLRNQQKARWRAYAEKKELACGDKKIKLMDVMEGAGKRKMAELYALMKGLESFAGAAEKTWAFVTLTAPPNMHPNPSHGKNTWDGTTPDQAHAWLHDAWHRAEARLRKLGIVISGLRVAEPHKDGCPHWHVLIFADPFEMAEIEATLREQEEWATDAGMKFVRSNGKASAASYAFKYVMKTVNSIEQLGGEAGTVDAWRSTWGIRAFQWFGMPGVGLWRDLRRLKECPPEPRLAGIWHAAKRGDGHAFIGLAGGLNRKARERPVRATVVTSERSKTVVFSLKEKPHGKSTPTGPAALAGLDMQIRVSLPKWRDPKAILLEDEEEFEGSVEVIQNDPREAKPLFEPWPETDDPPPDPEEFERDCSEFFRQTGRWPTEHDCVLRWPGLARLINSQMAH